MVYTFTISTYLSSDLSARSCNLLIWLIYSKLFISSQSGYHKCGITYDVTVSRRPWSSGFGITRKLRVLYCFRGHLIIKVRRGIETASRKFETGGSLCYQKRGQVETLCNKTRHSCISEVLLVGSWGVGCCDSKSVQFIQTECWKTTTFMPTT